MLSPSDHLRGQHCFSLGKVKTSTIFLYVRRMMLACDCLVGGIITPNALELAFSVLASLHAFGLDRMYVYACT